MQESSGSIDIKEERNVIPDKNVVVMPVEESPVCLSDYRSNRGEVNLLGKVIPLRYDGFTILEL